MCSWLIIFSLSLHYFCRQTKINCQNWLHQQMTNSRKSRLKFAFQFLMNCWITCGPLFVSHDAVGWSYCVPSSFFKTWKNIPLWSACLVANSNTSNNKFSRPKFQIIKFTQKLVYMIYFNDIGVILLISPLKNTICCNQTSLYVT